MAEWQNDHRVAGVGVRDNSGIDLDIFVAHIEIDLDDMDETEVAGGIH